MRRICFAWTIAAIAALAPALALASDAEDEATAKRIAAALRDSGRMQNYSVGVKYQNGTVWLSGRVTSEKQMQAALDVVSGYEGIEKIVNGLDVAAPAKMKQPAGVSKNPPPRQRRVHRRRRRASATTADLVRTDDDSMPQPVARKAARPVADEADGDAVPAGYHKLHAKHAMRPPLVAPGPGAIGGVNPPAYDQPHMPNYAWPSYASYPNYAAVSYPKQYSPTAFPYIGPFYPYPQVPLGWRKVSLEWDDGWWFLDFYDRSHH